MKLSIALVLACVGCGAAEGPLVDPLPTGDDAGPDGNSLPACAATDCCPIPPIVCNEWRFQQGPNDPGPLVEYPIDCPTALQDPNCFPWSVNPSRYSPQTWAMCCYTN